jgi:hypothetical protein
MVSVFTYASIAYLCIAVLFTPFYLFNRGDNTCLASSPSVSGTLCSTLIGSIEWPILRNTSSKVASVTP